MILKEELREIVRSQRKTILESEAGVTRDKTAEIDTDMPFAIVISGIRRCGKSTVLRQLLKGRENFYYFNFEDARAAAFEVSDFQKLNEVFTEEFGKANCYFFDEIQNVQKWELFVRQMLDQKFHFVLTGSNASLLSRELGTRLTGRHLRYELFPFSFKEFLKFAKSSPDLKAFEIYFEDGGFPEYLKNKHSEILSELLNNIIARDIIVRYKLRNAKLLKEMSVYMLTNTGKEFSYTALKKTFGLGSTNSAISFVSHFEDSYLLFTIPKFSYSMKEQVRNPRKAYAIDNGLAAANSVSFSKDKGRMLENLVFLQLRRKYKDIYYFKEERECDFIVKEKGKIAGAFQVCFELNSDNKDREIKGLQEAIEKVKPEKATILTFNQDDELSISGRKIRIMPVWKWMIE